MRVWFKGMCSYCDAGAEVEVDVLETVRPRKMCRVCYGLGLSDDRSQNDRPVTPVDLSRAVRMILEALAPAHSDGGEDG